IIQQNFENLLSDQKNPILQSKLYITNSFIAECLCHKLTFLMAKTPAYFKEASITIVKSFNVRDKI
ncbi:MAG: hypothetical protein ACK56I_00985, partial [bacterium]